MKYLLVYFGITIRNQLTKIENINENMKKYREVNYFEDFMSG